MPISLSWAPLERFRFVNTDKYGRSFSAVSPLEHFNTLAPHRRVVALLSLFQVSLAHTLARIPQFILNALGAHNSGDGHYPDWRMVFANDLLSTVGWAFWLGAVFALGYSWSGRIPCV